MSLYKLTIISLLYIFMSFSPYTGKIYGEEHQNKITFKVVNSKNENFTNESFNNLTILHFGDLDSSTFIRNLLDLTSLYESKKHNFSYIPIIYNTKEDIALFKSGYHISTELYTDKMNYTKNSASLQLLPFIYILDKNGCILFQYSGALDVNLLDKNLESLKNLTNGEK